MDDRQEEHDREWSDETTHADTRRHLVCACGAERWERRRGCGCHS